MNRFKKGYRNFVIAVAIIPILIMTILAWWNNTKVTEHPTSEDYNILKEYCVKRFY